MGVPRFNGNGFVDASLVVWQFDVGLELHAILVLMESIKKGRDQFLRVVLVVAQELIVDLNPAITVTVLITVLIV